MSNAIIKTLFPSPEFGWTYQLSAEQNFKAVLYNASGAAALAALVFVLLRWMRPLTALWPIGLHVALNPTLDTPFMSQDLRTTANHLRDLIEFWFPPIRKTHA